MGWLLAINKSINLWLAYIVTYSILTWIVCKIFESYKIYFINQIISVNIKKSEKIRIFIIILRIGGLPPFIGFLPKWITIQRIINNKELMILLIIIIFRLIILIYYIRIITNIILNFNSPVKWITYKNNKNVIIIATINFLLPVTIIIDIL